MKHDKTHQLFPLAAMLLISYSQFSYAESSSSEDIAAKTVDVNETSNKWTARREIGSPQSAIKLCLSKTGNQWTQMPECDLSKSGTELISLDPWSKEIYLSAEPPKKISQMGTSDPVNGWECYRGALGTSFRNGSQYSICASDLTKNNAGAAEMVIGNLFNVALGTVRTTVIVDTELLLTAAAQSGAFTTAEAWRQQVDLQRYRDQFESANTSSKFEAFIQSYKNNDPDNLLPQAAIRRDELRAQEARNKAIAEQERVAQLKRAQALQNDQMKQDEIRRKERQKEISEFRRTIKIETKTNCGPVLEIKGQLAKIYFPVQNYGNEHWIDKSTLFPWNYRCLFLNGQYQPPAP